jgi:hypothetical protein
MPRLIEAPAVIEAAGNKAKRIEEFAGRVKSRHERYAEFPEVTYDATIKIEHIINQREILPLLKTTGCLFITSAVESVDDTVLRYLDKNHSGEDFTTAVDALQREIQALVEEAEGNETSRRELFDLIWALAHKALGHRTPLLPVHLGAEIPHMSEPWYCCAEPTSQQLQRF